MLDSLLEPLILILILKDSLILILTDLNLILILEGSLILILIDLNLILIVEESLILILILRLLLNLILKVSLEYLSSVHKGITIPDLDSEGIIELSVGATEPDPEGFIEPDPDPDPEHH